MFLDFLPENINNSLSNLSMDKIYEIRLRLNRNIIVFYNDKYVTLNELCKNDVKCLEKDIDYIIQKITENSIYAYNEEIKKGFITTKDGIRIGLCGKVVMIDGQVKTITQFSSLNIRIPHNILDCSNEIFNKLIVDSDMKNILICSKPFMGKTTIIKDLSRKINDILHKQTLIIDERNEFCTINGDYIDKIVCSNKYYAFNYAVRSMSPEVVICDELSNKNDWLYIKKASITGINFIASCHCDSVEKLKKNKNFINNVFDYYVFLEDTLIKGKIKSIYDSKFNVI